jgi:hypothetical protein
MSRTFLIPTEAYLAGKRSAYYRLLCQQDVDLFLTLNFNRERTMAEVRHQLGQLLARVDRQYLGAKWCRRHSDERAFAMGIFVNSDSNTRLHALWRMPARVRTSSVDAQAHSIKHYWDKLQPAGSCKIEQIQDLLRVARHMCKQLDWHGQVDDCIIFSTDFHSRMQKSPSK